MIDWQPIETVPKPTFDEAKIVLLWIVNGGGDGKGEAAPGIAYVREDGLTDFIVFNHPGKWDVSHWAAINRPDA